MKTRLILILLLTSYIIPLDAQPVLDIIRKNPAYATCNYNTYPNTLYKLTPAPKGKHPFYISHYGRHGSRYINNPKGYNIPQADQSHSLTAHVIKQISNGCLST